MKKYLTILAVVFSITITTAQEDAWVYFTDKPNAEFYLANPLEMLSQRALERRETQGIAIDEKDVPIHQEYVTEISNTPGITVMAKSKWLNCVHVRGTYEAINALTGLNSVASVDFANKLLNFEGRGTAAQINPVNKILDTEVNFDYGTSANQIEMLNGHILHQQGYTGEGMIIAVIDAGFPGVDTGQPFQRLSDNNLILGGYDFVANSDDFYTANSHGTLVLSTIGGYTEGQLVGTAPDAFYYLFRTEDAASENPVEESYWVEAAEMADSLGVDVINTSLGYFDYDNPGYNYTYEDIDGNTAFITRGANIAFTRGMLCVTSGGNSGNSADPHIGVPADAFNTLSVGAVNAEEEYTSFSSIGPTFDMRVKPDVMAQGVASVLSNTNGEIIAANGTSFSSPITAGLVACLWQALPEKTNAEILQIIKESADRYTSPDVQYGYGIPDFALALQNALGLDTNKKQDFILYPNPVAATLSISYEQPYNCAHVVIYNNLGQVVQEVMLSQDKPSFSVEGLAKGFYSYTITSGNKTQTGKLIKE